MSLSPPFGRALDSRPQWICHRWDVSTFDPLVDPSAPNQLKIKPEIISGRMQCNNPKESLSINALV